MKKAIIVTLLLHIVGVFASADWVNLDDFTDGDTVGWTLHTDVPLEAQAEPASMMVGADPLNPANNVLILDHGAIGGDDNSLRMHSNATFTFPEPIVDPFPNSGVVTVYFRHYIPIVNGLPGNVGLVWGIGSDTEMTQSAEYGNYFHYGDLSVIGRYSAEGNLQIYDGTNSYQTTPAYSDIVEVGVWMELWAVIDHGNNVTDWYALGGSFPTITKIYEDAGYRAETLENLTDFVVRLNAGGVEAPGGSDDVYIDDLNIDLSGENLTTPPTVDGASAGWVNLDDFTDGDTVGWTLHTDVPVEAQAEPASMMVGADPLNPANNVLILDHGAIGGDDNSLRMHSNATFTFPEPIVDPFPNSGVVTVYFRHYIPIVNGLPGNVGLVWGIGSDTEMTQSAEYGNYFHYGDLSVIGRYSAEGNLQIYDGTNSYQTTPAFPDIVEVGVWMELWAVIDHGNNVTDWYALGGSFPTITKIYEDAGYRAETLENLTDFVVRLNAGGVEAPGGSDDVYIDDLNIDLSGENLTTPPTVGGGQGSDNWGGYSVDENGWVDTDTWLSWLNVTFAPWIWSSSLDTWVYLPEPEASAPGAWLYILR